MGPTAGFTTSKLCDLDRWLSLLGSALIHTVRERGRNIPWDDLRIHQDDAGPGLESRASQHPKMRVAKTGTQRPTSLRPALCPASPHSWDPTAGLRKGLHLTPGL